jgi:hypothetical protein
MSEFLERYLYFKTSIFKKISQVIYISGIYWPGGYFTFKNIIQFYNVKGLTRSPFKHNLTVRFDNFLKMEFNSLYWFTFPGFVLYSGGLYIGLDLLRTFSLGGSLAFWPTVLMVILTLIGTGMTFTGILLHSISGLLRHIRE